MKNCACTIRHANEQDLPAIVVLGYSQLLFHSYIDPARWGHPVSERLHAERWRPHIEEMLRGKDGLVLVGDVDKSVVGFLAGKLETLPPVVVGPPYLAIQDLHVAEEHRGTGIGTALIEEALRWGRARGASRVVLSVMVTNQDAISFYARHGFTARDMRMTREL